MITIVYINASGLWLFDGLTFFLINIINMQGSTKKSNPQANNLEQRILNIGHN
jgi:hypothetical protein